MSDTIKPVSAATQGMIDKVLADLKSKQPKDQPLSRAQECLSRAFAVSQVVNQQYNAYANLTMGVVHRNVRQEHLIDLFMEGFKSWSPDDLRYLVACLHVAQISDRIS